MAVRYEITTAKPAGAISGVQHTEGGPVEYSDKMPQSCRLSKYYCCTLSVECCT